MVVKDDGGSTTRAGPAAVAACAWAALLAVVILSGCATTKSGGASATDLSTPTTSAPRPASAGNVPVVRWARTAEGVILVTPRGRPVYRFSGDTAGGVGSISCVGACTAAWRPLTLPPSDLTPVAARPLASRLGLVRRPGGEEQITYLGAPLYTRAPGAHARLATSSGRWSEVRAGGASPGPRP